MKKKLIAIAIIFSVIIIAVTAVFYINGLPINSQQAKSEKILELNEIQHLIENSKNEKAIKKIEQLQQDIRTTSENNKANVRIIIMGCVCLLLLIIIFSYIYFAILRPFYKLEKFAEQIAQGNFDIPLHYERSNYFGKFTWAFDNMRREITKARQCEREAIDNNKTVIATLSHDIKTPISSIRTYAEALEANLDNTAQKRQKYISVIMKKCDEVAKLTNDLFLHSLSDLDKLKINNEKFEICDFMQTAISEIAAEKNDVNLIKSNFSAIVLADKNRILQITENLISNARKYAKSKIDISLLLKDSSVEVHFRDYGNGICDEDMPFIFEKFYRGKNKGNEQGSGLGLYIVKYLITQMDGNVLLHNHSDGLEAIITLPIQL